MNAIAQLIVLALSLGLGSLLAWSAWSSISTGIAPDRWKGIVRDKQPALFWTLVGIDALGVLGMAALAIYAVVRLLEEHGQV